MAYTDKNLYAYCDNNPVMRVDNGGEFWDTVFDVVSLCFSVVDVVKNPDDPWAWVGLAADVVSLAVPFATGGGLIVDAVTKADDVVDLAKTIDKGLDAADTVTDIGKGIGNVAEGVETISDTSKGVTNIMGGACFVAGTLIETNGGSIPIEEIDVGSQVYAHNPETGETTLKEVVHVFVRQSAELVHITVNGETITTTPSHPFWVTSSGWRDAIQLRAGDRLQLLNGEHVIVEQVQHELLETPITVYNFEVKDFHTYYVGTNNVLVHNDCAVNTLTDISKRFTPDQQAVIDLGREAYKNGGISASEADILWEWAQEYGLSVQKTKYHKPMFDSYKNGQVKHIKIHGKHIDILD